MHQPFKNCPFGLEMYKFEITIAHFRPSAPFLRDYCNTFLPGYLPGSSPSVLFSTLQRELSFQIQNPIILCCLKLHKGFPASTCRSYLRPLCGLYKAHRDRVPALPSSASFLDTPHLPCTFNSSLTKMLAALCKPPQLYNSHQYDLIIYSPLLKHIISCVCCRYPRSAVRCLFLLLIDHCKEQQSVNYQTTLTPCE